MTTVRANRLAREKSPYLLQHARNPVDWFAWGEEAFARARQENKPVFLSVGYSTCHWCHVMERESFEDGQVAAFLNEHFVSIKVDREERPDVDKIYMTFVQATTGQGGWPMSVFLTPERKPFYGGTYFPPENAHNRPGFLQILRQIQHLWETRRDHLTGSAGDIHARLEQALATASAPDGPLTAGVLRQAGLRLKELFDPDHGGFGGAPKFPQPSQPLFLLRYAARFGDPDAVRMVLRTCDRMAAGGIHDQLGGGFARYAVDAQWLVPHFEKMLYDNAQLAQLYLDAFLVSGEARHAEVVRDILGYVLRDMTHPAGGFFSAEDADSEGHEGKFYCWTRQELSKLLTPGEFKLAARHFGITERGNFVDHSHPSPLPGQNVLSVIEPVSDPADLKLLASAKTKMLAARDRRVRPHLDDKVLASWNGLMLGALARAYAVLGDETYRAAAEKNLAFIQAMLWQPPPEQTGVSRPEPERRTPIRQVPLAENHTKPVPGGRAVRSADQRQPAGAETGAPVSASAEATSATGTLFHRWRDGEHDRVQLLGGYAFLLSGVIELYEATIEPRHLDFAVALADALLAKFYDAPNGGFWQSAAEAGDLILRVKEDYDGAEPSGNSVAALALLKLGAITGRKEFTAAALKTLRRFSARLQETPQAVPHLLLALDFSLQEPRRAVVVGDPKVAKVRELLRAIHSVAQTNKIVLGTTGEVEPFARTLPARDGPVVYLCSGHACQPPTDDPAGIRLQM